MKPAGALPCRLVPVLMLLVTVGLSATPPVFAGQHPRIFFRAEDLTGGRNLRGRTTLTGSHCEEYAKLETWADLQWGSIPSDLAAEAELSQQSALTYAFLYQLSGEVRYARRAVKLARDLVTSRRGRLPGFEWPELTVTVATVFDWCYDQLSPADRQRLLYDILKRCIYIRDRKAPDNPGRFDRAVYLKPLLFAVLALEGEPEAARYLPEWKSYCDRTLRQRVLADLEATGNEGAWLPWAGGLERELDVLECLEAWGQVGEGGLSGPDAGRNELPRHFRNLTRRILYRLRPGFVLAGTAGDFPRRPGVPTELLYLLAARQDEPSGRWLAEMLRLHSPPQPGSAAWLKDLRARILWLPKGRRRLAPAEAGLPTAECFGDTGEFITRSGWDFLDPAQTWFLFRVSAKEASPYPFWNHISLVRGEDPLTVEANIWSPAESNYSDYWFGRPRAQNTVVPSSSTPRGVMQFALEGYQVGPELAVVRGHASADGSGAEKFDLVRELAVFPAGVVVIHDRVDLKQGRPVWILHTFDQPELSGEARWVAGLAGDGVNRSLGAKGATWRTGKSKAYLRVLLPQTRSMRTIGGRTYGFWLDGVEKSLWPVRLLGDDGEVRYSEQDLRRWEVGTWRVEVASTAQEQVTDFLTVLVAAAPDEAEPEVALESESGVRVVWRNRRYQVRFSGQGTGTAAVTDLESGREVLRRDFQMRGGVRK